MLWYNEYGCPFLNDDNLAIISRDYDVLRCLVEEQVMASSSELWSSGKRKWYVSYEGEEGPKRLLAEGDLLDALESI